MKNSLSIILTLMFLLSFNLLAEEKNWPTTVAEAVKNILRTMDNDFREQIKSTAKEELILYHHGWGTGIRNDFGLWRGNKKLIVSACGKPCHPDEASMKIIEAVWEKLHANP